MPSRPVAVAVLGAGSWGHNLVRAFAGLPRCALLSVADPSREARSRVAAEFPRLRLLASSSSALLDPGVEAVAIATPSATHAPLAAAALRAGKHVLVEKPLALSSRDARALGALARRRGLRLMAGHLLEYHPGFQKVLELAHGGRLGRILYAYAHRLNLGDIRRSDDVLWSLAPHDLSMLLTLFGALQRAVSARGGAYVEADRHDVVFLTLQLPSGSVAHVPVSWLDPRKIRCLTVVGDRRMAVFDDMEPAEKVRVYEKRADIRAPYASYGESIAVHSGEVWIPRLPAVEPLRAECAHFLECVRTGREPLTGARSGLDVVRVLEAASAALASGLTVRVRA